MSLYNTCTNFLIYFYNVLSKQGAGAYLRSVKGGRFIFLLGQRSDLYLSNVIYRAEFWLAGKLLTEWGIAAFRHRMHRSFLFYVGLDVFYTFSLQVSS